MTDAVLGPTTRDSAAAGGIALVRGFLSSRPAFLGLAGAAGLLALFYISTSPRYIFCVSLWEAATLKKKNAVSL